MTQTRGGAIGAETDPHGCLHGAKDADNAYWAHECSGPRSQHKGGRTRPNGRRKRLRSLPII